MDGVNEEELKAEDNWERIKDSQVFLDPPTISCRNADRGNSTRLVLMSDTHGRHRDIKLPAGDVLIHAGDLTTNGQLSVIRSLSSFFERAAPKYSQILCIAGNHDITFHPDFYAKEWNQFHLEKVDDGECRAALRHCTYLEDDASVIKKGELQVYGSPWTPYFCNWAFNLCRGEEILQKWRQIPARTDVLITHGPPLGRGDRAENRDVCSRKNRPIHRTGCYDLLQQVQTRIHPRVHVFGHIHEDRGVTYDGHTLFVNASNVDLAYRPCHPCIVVDVPHDTKKSAVVVTPECHLQNTDLQQWFVDREYASLATYMTKVKDIEAVPSGNALLDKDALMRLCDLMLLHRDRSACKSLTEALSEMYAESFGE